MTEGVAGPGLRRRLGFGLLTLYGVGVMVGAGIYVLVGQVAGATGTWAPMAFVIAGLLALPTAISYAELTTRIPESAGEAAYVRAASGSGTLAALVGLAVATAGVVSAAAVLQGGVGYLGAVVAVPDWVLVIVVGLSLTGFAVLGVVESLALAAILTLIEVAGLVIVVGAGFSAPVAVEGTGVPAISGLAAGALLAFFAFIGFEDMVNMAEETRDPERTMPRAIFAAVAVTTALYLLVAWAAVRAVPAEALAESRRPLALVFETATGRGAGFLALIAVAAALNGVLAQVVMSARILYGLGRFAAPFKVFFHAHSRFGTPVAATLVASAIVLVLALTAPLRSLAEITALVLLAVFVAINAALVAIRRTPAPPGAFRAPGWVPWTGAILSAGALIAGIAGMAV